MAKSHDFSSARADGWPDRAGFRQAGNSSFPAVPALSGYSGGASLPFGSVLPEPWLSARMAQLGPRIWVPDGPDPGPGWPGSGVPDARIRAGKGHIRGPQGLPGGPGAGQVLPARPSRPGQPRPSGPWMLSNTCPGSPWGDPDDRVRSTEHAGTKRVMLSSRTTSRHPGTGP